MRDHTKLRAFELANQLAVATYRVTARFPNTERFGLVSQMRRAAVSIASNIVEGCARHTERDYLHMLDVAYGSSCELHYQSSLARQLGFLPEDVHQKFDEACKETSKVLNGLISALRHPE